VGAVRENVPSMRKKNVYAPILRWIGLGVAAVLVLVAVLSFFFPAGNPVRRESRFFLFVERS
jgi:hypothetical protein